MKSIMMTKISIYEEYSFSLCISISIFSYNIGFIKIYNFPVHTWAILVAKDCFWLTVLELYLESDYLDEGTVECVDL